MILAKGRVAGDIALAVASSGIAAILLQGGRTAHSRFKIPINVQADSFCSIKAQSELAKLIRQAKVVLWDEAPMQHRYVAEAVERTFRDNRKSDNRPFGGGGGIFSGGSIFLCFSSLFTILFKTFFIQATFGNALQLFPKASVLKLLTPASIMHHSGATSSPSPSPPTCAFCGTVPT